MAYLNEVQTPPMRLESFRGVVSKRQLEQLIVRADELKAQLAGKVVWNVSSTAAGGGVAEMLHRLIGYARGAGFDSRWLVLSGAPAFFRITKRLHNALHGEAGDGTPLDEHAHEQYLTTLRANGEELRQHVRRGDIVFLHDPQTAGLVPMLSDCGVAVVWRCHIGNGQVGNDHEQAGWDFLRRYLKPVTCCVFTRAQYVPGYLQAKSVVIPPNIDPVAPKNQHMTPGTVRAILRHIDVIGGPAARGKRVFVRTDGTPTRVERKALIVRAGEPPAPETPLVVQVSRWDRLKDPLGVMRGFVRFAVRKESDGAALLLVGPESAAVADDPEGAEVYQEVVRAWEKLDDRLRERVHLVSLPMDDAEENAAMVNAIQRHATVVVQKSLREGFGLTVTEAMWKGRPVIGGAVGGIQDQIEHEKTGLLVDPENEEAFAAALVWLFEDPKRAAGIGRRARARVKREYLGVQSLLRWAALVSCLIEGRPVPSLGK